MHRNAQYILYLTRCLFPTALSSHSQFEDLQKQWSPTTWAKWCWVFSFFCNSQKPTLAASHASSPCVHVRHSEKLWKEPAETGWVSLVVALVAAHKNMHERMQPIKGACLKHTHTSTSRDVKLKSLRQNRAHPRKSKRTMHTYLSASRWWGLVTCVIAVRALRHSRL